ncbi:hypothetical protein PGT21_011525 [Puccinia graminis f. sp. tritici]|uniref:Uncharacterized protein n=1 Tax=Puccinia graminis f. sp. tritici TaxID=56615 RepID=A0A5B0P522_PUCGR|nr:hypothetical protein PGT21_035122 [Puccinia graminis f. sp. tritici]KAA1118964.1 hypothetical protein PGT21_011525 [Puccinia graminis f. sp. tritici]KAA1121324.1 hypothetical protein PGTUg99_007819 [Puccinia graminis f. sp. tritici]
MVTDDSRPSTKQYILAPALRISRKLDSPSPTTPFHQVRPSNAQRSVANPTYLSVSETARVMEWTARPLLRRRRSWRHSTQRSGVHLSLFRAPERNASGHVQRLGCQPPRRSREPTTRWVPQDRPEGVRASRSAPPKQKRTPECALEGVRPKTRARHDLEPNTSASVP